MASSFPPIPPFNTLRPAKISDIPRISIVAMAGFYYGTLWPHLHPHHAEYPHHTYLHYAAVFSTAVRNPNHVVLVAEDAYELDEDSKTEASLNPGDDYDVGNPREGDRVVVGVMDVRFEEGSARRGQFMDWEDEKKKEGEKRYWNEGERLDSDEEHAKKYWGTVGRFEEKYVLSVLISYTPKPQDKNDELMTSRYFKNNSELDKMAVHPGYWRRGHGTALAKWATQLADMDGVSQGVAGVGSMGPRLYARVGFERLESFVVEDKIEVKVETTMMRYEPKDESKEGPLE